MNTTMSMPSGNSLQRWLIPVEPTVRRGSWRRWRRFLALLYIPVTAAGLYGYIDSWSATLVIGALALCQSPGFDKQPNSSFRFGWPALFFAGLFFVAPVRTVVYAALVCAICLYGESFYRRVEKTSVFILALLTPIAGYFANAFSFPIRLQLTTMAGTLMTAAGLPVTVAGNTVSFRHHLFSVDPACMGLHMLIVSLLTTLLLINVYQRKQAKRLSAGMIVLLLAAATALNIFSNLMRIISLVVLLILPDNPWHGIFGLLFLSIYVLLPLLPMIRYTIRRHGRPVLTNRLPSTVRSRRILAGNVLVAAIVTLVVMLHLFRQNPAKAPAAGIDVPGYTMRQRGNNILQLDNSRSLVYIKPIPGFYYTDHTPSICWQGSGYTFTDLRISTYADIRVYEGSLQKGAERLYTAWWYDDGIKQTINPIEWRWDLIRGAPGYSVVNITSADRTQLRTEIIHVLNTHPFRMLLGQPAAAMR